MKAAYPSPFNLQEEDPNLAMHSSQSMDAEGNPPLFGEEVPPAPEMPPAEAVIPPVPPGPVPVPEEMVSQIQDPAVLQFGPGASMGPMGMRPDDEMMRAMRAGMGR